MRLLGIVGSPRRRGNTTILLEQLAAGVIAGGGEANLLRPAEMNIAPCIACEGCYRSGRCVVLDEYQSVYDAIIDCDALALATPVYFGGVSGWAKPLIDRCQCYWAMRDILHASMPAGPARQARQGILISACALDRPRMFDGVRTTFRFLMRSLQGTVRAELLYPGLEERDAIRR
jgi:multimeric flavodoxin WrbA